MTDDEKPKKSRKGRPKKGTKASKGKIQSWIRQELKKTPWHFNISEAAEKWNVNHETMSGYHKEVLQSLNFINLEQTKYDIYETYKRVSQTANKEFDNPELPARERAQWAKLALEAGDKTTTFYEAWGVKPKIADELSISDSPASLIVKRLLEE